MNIIWHKPWFNAFKLNNVEKKEGLCGVCHFRRACSLTTSTGAVFTCSEYQPDRTFREVNEYRLSSYSSIVSEDKSIKGLCKNCELQKACNWYSAEHITFHCEHYK